jgi:hypothetical protein
MLVIEISLLLAVTVTIVMAKLVAQLGWHLILDRRIPTANETRGHRPDCRVEPSFQPVLGASQKRARGR